MSAPQSVSDDAGRRRMLLAIVLVGAAARHDIGQRRTSWPSNRVLPVTVTLAFRGS